jgi:hypothetical protein
VAKVVIESGYSIHNGIRVANAFTPVTYGRLTAIGPAFSLSTPGKWRRRWFQVFQCTCGTVVPVCLESAVAGDTTSCGCFASELTKTRSTVHGMRKSPEYVAWTLAKARCYRTTCEVYCHYGQRGIKMCDRWLEPNGRGFLNFLSDMGRKPSLGHSLDRIDVNGDYCPENCVWSTKVEQARNKRSNINLSYNGRTMCATAWAAELGISPDCIRYRKKQGWPDEKVLTTPVRPTRKGKNDQ